MCIIYNLYVLYNTCVWDLPTLKPNMENPSKKVKRKAPVVQEFIPVAFKFEDKCLSLNDQQGNCLAEMELGETWLFVLEGKGTLATVLAVLDAMKAGEENSLGLSSADTDYYLSCCVTQQTLHLCFDRYRETSRMSLPCASQAAQSVLNHLKECVSHGMQ
jgi:hypothetical protein